MIVVKQPIRAVAHMAIANPLTFHSPVPYLSEQGASCREGQGNEQCHCDSRRPAVLSGWVAAPNDPGARNCGQSVEQRERQKLCQINVGAVAAERIGNLSDWNAMIFPDLYKQSLHACVPLSIVGFTRVWTTKTKVGIGISNRKIFRELCVRTEMASTHRMMGEFFRPSAIGITPIAADASAHP